MGEPTKSDWNEFNDPAIVDWRRIRTSIQHENDLTNHRQTWLLTSQAFLFAAFGYVFMSASNKEVADQFRPLFPWLLGLIALVGVLVSVMVQRSIIHAEKQHEELRTWWLVKYGNKDAEIKPETDRQHPPIAGQVHSRFAPSMLPVVFITAWIGGLILAAAFSGLLTKDIATRTGYVLLILVTAIAIFFAGVVYTKSRQSSANNRK